MPLADNHVPEVTPRRGAPHQQQASRRYAARDRQRALLAAIHHRKKVAPVCGATAEHKLISLVGDEVAASVEGGTEVHVPK